MPHATVDSQPSGVPVLPTVADKVDNNSEPQSGPVIPPADPPISQSLPRSQGPPDVPLIPMVQANSGSEHMQCQLKSTDQSKPEEGTKSDENKKWANLFQQNRFSSNGMSLEYIPPTIIDGKPVGFLGKIEVEMEENRWKSALVAFVLGSTPGYNAMKRFISLHWSHVPEPDLFYHEGGYYVVKFKSMMMLKKYYVLVLILLQIDQLF